MFQLLPASTKKIVFLLFICIPGIGNTLSAQSSIFSRQFKSTGTEAYVISHIATSDGGTLLLNDQRKVSTGQHYLDLLKTDAQGNLQWTKRFGPLLFGLKNVVQSPDGSYFFCFTQNPFGHFYEMIKLDANGNVLFDKRIDLPVYYRVGIYPMSMARNDGGYYVATTVVDTIAGITHWNLFSLDANGTLLWSNSYNADTFTSDVAAIDTCADGDIILQGQYYDLTSMKWGVIVTRVNPAGSMVWTKDYYAVGIYDYYPREITHIGNNIVLAAVAYNSTSAEYSTVLMKLDNTGSIIWSWRYSNSVRQLDPFDILPVENNDFAVTGTAFTPNIASYFLKVDSFGLVYNGRLYMNWNIHSVQMINNYQYSISGTYNDSIYPQAAYLTSAVTGTGCADGSLVITRSPITFSTGNGSGFQSFPFTIVAGTTPSPVATYTGDDICRITGIENESPDSEAISVFPSPASDRIHISSTEKISSAELLDLHGKIVGAAYPNATTCDLDVAELPSGMYVLRVYSATDVSMRKFVIQH